MPPRCETEEDLFAKPIIFLAGPTAIGKTELAITVAEELGCEIIGVDSMQIYRYMDIGTAKPSRVERGRVPHHLIDYVLPDEDFSASRFASDCQDAIRQIRSRGRIPLLVGGTGLYFAALEHGIFAMPDLDPQVRHALQAELAERGRDALWQELQGADPETTARLHRNDTYRLLRALEIKRATGRTWSQYLADHQGLKAKKEKTHLIKLGLERDRDDLYQRINRRVTLMIETGLLAEVEKLLAMGYNEKIRPMQSLGYRHMLAYRDGTWGWEQSLELLARDTRRYAKRQLTWFHADSTISWFHPDQMTTLIRSIKERLADAQSNIKS